MPDVPKNFQKINHSTIKYKTILIQTYIRNEPPEHLNIKIKISSRFRHNHFNNHYYLKDAKATQYTICNSNY